MMPTFEERVAQIVAITTLPTETPEQYHARCMTYIDRAGLNARHRFAAAMHDLGSTQAKIAAALGVSRERVRSMLAKAHGLMRKCADRGHDGYVYDSTNE
jgi:hypothetical protein